MLFKALRAFRPANCLTSTVFLFFVTGYCDILARLISRSIDSLIRKNKTATVFDKYKKISALIAFVVAGCPKESPGAPKESPGVRKESPGAPKESPGGPKESPGGPKENPGDPKENP